MISKAWNSIIVISIALGIYGCSDHVQKSLSFDYSIPISDPLLLKLTPILERLEVEAEGKLAPGLYQIGSNNGKLIPIRIVDGTVFKLSVQLPIHGSSTISTKETSGKLETTQAILVSGVPAPTSITLEQGNATLDVNLARAITACVINMINGDAAASDTKTGAFAMIDEFHVPRATLNLKNSSTVQLNRFKIGLESGKIVLDNVRFQNKSDYQGTCTVRASIKEITRPEQKSSFGTIMRDCSLKLKFSAERKKNILALKLHPDFDNIVDMKNFELTKQSSYLRAGFSRANFKSIEFIHPMNTVDKSLTGSLEMLLGSSDLRIDAKGRAISGQLRVKNHALIDLDVEGEKDFVEVNVPSARANNVVITLSKPKSEVEVDLREGNITSLLFSKDGNTTATLSRGDVTPSAVHWTSGNKRVDISLQKNTKLLIDQPVKVTTTSDGAISLKKLPLEVNSGRITVSNGREKLILNSVTGKVLVSIEGGGAAVQGKISAHAGEQALLGIPDVNVSIKEISLSSKVNHVQIHLAGCRLTVAREALKESIKKSLAHGKTFSVNKSVFSDRKWRYRNMVLESVRVDEPVLSTLNLNQKGIKLTGAAKVTADGTVERLNLKVNPLSKEARGWIKKPWSGQGTISGQGDILLTVHPNSSLRESEIKYDAHLRFNVPDNLSLDWSKVDEGLLGKSERKLVGAVIKHAGVFSASEGIPLNAVGSLKLLKNSDSRLRLVRITNVVLIPSKNKLEMVFAADANLL